jgi:hypothetical protein
MLKMLSAVLQAFLPPVLIYIWTWNSRENFPFYILIQLFKLYEGLIYKGISLGFPINTWYGQPPLTILAQTLSLEILLAAWKLELSHTFQKLLCPQRKLAQLLYLNSRSTQ